MTTIKVTDDSFETDVLKASTPVLVDFWAEWCGPCKQIGPALEQIADEMAGQVTVAKLNIDDSPMTPSKLGVKGDLGDAAFATPIRDPYLSNPIARASATMAELSAQRIAPVAMAAE